MQSPERSIGVLGATSLAGRRLLSPEINQCDDFEEKFIAFTRNKNAVNLEKSSLVQWCHLSASEISSLKGSIENWICLCPVWILSDYFDMLKHFNIRRIIALSSTSCFTKSESIDPSEQKIAQQLIEGEDQLKNWAKTNDIEWVILRPTLIYGFGQDKNIAAVARFIRRFRFFPLLGKAKGLRQPIHADDVATACLQALREPRVANQAYNISGSETLRYDEMVQRVFSALGMKPRYLRVPTLIFRVGVRISKWLPRVRNVSPGMAERMNSDLIFDHTDACRDFNFQPREFLLQPQDVGIATSPE